jgi:3-oxoadipate enol-lactonase
MPTVDRGGWRLAYEVAGEGAGTVVLTHGLGSTGAVFAPQVRALADEGYRVVTWDLRAHGRSGAPDVPCSVADLGGDLTAVVDAVRAATVHVLGFSAGGVVAMRFAIDHPARVRSLVLVGTSSECNPPAKARYESMATTAERDGGTAVLPLVGVRPEGELPPDGRGFAHVARAVGGLHEMPLTPELASIRCPALVAVGERDPLGVGGSVIIHRRLAQARLEILPRLRHAVCRENPDGFNRLLLDFLRSVR